MRASNRTPILDAAHRVVERGGLTAVTFEAVAAEAGLTKGGLLYHFPTKEDLLLAMHEHLAAEWETALLAELGTPYEESTPDDRLRAYVRISSAAVTRAELVLMLDAHLDTRYAAPWIRVTRRWTPTPTGSRPADLDRVVAHVAADGLWLYEAVNGEPLDEELRARLAERIAARIDG